jgi:hypothetical protein
MQPPSQNAPADTASKPASKTVQLSRWLAVGSVMGLIILGLAWELVLSPLRPGGSWIALKVVPLCFPLAGLLRNRMYTYRWVSLLVWLYFIEGVVRAWGDKPPGNYLAVLEVFLCLTLFFACLMHIRLRLKSAEAASASAEAGSAEAPAPSDTVKTSP